MLGADTNGFGTYTAVVRPTVRCTGTIRFEWCPRMAITKSMPKRKDAFKDLGLGGLPLASP